MPDAYVRVFLNVRTSPNQISTIYLFPEIITMLDHVVGFEYAAQPGVSVEDKKAKLHFCVVGGGPTVRYQTF